MTETITVTGLSCEHCEQTVEEALEDVSGVPSADADRAARQVTVDGDADTETLAAAVEDAGYDATV